MWVVVSVCLGLCSDPITGSWLAEKWWLGQELVVRTTLRQLKPVIILWMAPACWRPVCMGSASSLLCCSICQALERGHATHAKLQGYCEALETEIRLPHQTTEVLKGNLSRGCCTQASAPLQHPCPGWHQAWPTQHQSQNERKVFREARASLLCPTSCLGEICQIFVFYLGRPLELPLVLLPF